MKRTVLLTSFICTMLVANFSFAQTKKKTTVVKKTTIATTVKTAKPSAADLVMGKQLISKSDCLTCHKMDAKLIGPGYNEVAQKYAPTEANYDMLTKKVIAGGSGNWGQVAMTPHPQLAATDVKKMVQYILSLK